MSARPVNTAEVADLVRSHRRVVVAGGRTKRGWTDSEGSEVLDLVGLSGITEYQASEYTFTARAGTRLREVREVLAAKGQHLPFDPHWVEAGATLGGTVVAGISGPGRFRFGGPRDFLLGIEFVDGTGSVVRSGGRVVKNAAGFDLPKFMVGSLGSFGVLTEVTFKVFPRAVETATLRIGCGDAEEAVRRIAGLAAGRLEAEAVEYEPSGEAVVVRIGGPPGALEALCAEVERGGVVRRMESGEGGAYWSGVGEFRWADGLDCLVKVPLTPSRMVDLERGAQAIDACRRRYSSGGAVGWLAFDGKELGAVDGLLGGLGLRGLVMGAGRRRWLGRRVEDRITLAVKEALDPEGRFPEL